MSPAFEAFGFGALVFPSVARMRIEGVALVESEESAGRRGFWVRKIEPRAFWDVVVRRVEREVKNWVVC